MSRQTKKVTTSSFSATTLYAYCFLDGGKTSCLTLRCSAIS
ncbi:MAG: hypothetical protein PUH57_03500 [Prevotellaceae bacterium]|nr:hypothetical protein [Prevotellaceae bacterium]MDY2748938.1 hypothetical protein [Prevotella sp.]